MQSEKLIVRQPHESESSDARHGGGATRSSGEAHESARSEGVASGRVCAQPTEREELCVQTKRFAVSKRAVWEAFKAVRAKGGAPGVDGISLERYEENLSNNLYKLWNRMSAGSYFPKPVLRVKIPKAGGGERALGIPTVEDRIAQRVAAQHVQARCEAQFHPDSYGYRTGKSAHDAVGQARQRCWKYAWVLDLDIKAFFDTLDHELVMKALEHFSQEKWVHLYVKRWLQAPVQTERGDIEMRQAGTPQGGVISPVLANMFMHFCFDLWMERKFPHVPFERYADDVVLHCRTRNQAMFMQAQISERLRKCKLELHPAKTKIVHCAKRSTEGNMGFDFLGFTFKRRVALANGRVFDAFGPALSRKAQTRMQQQVHEWKLIRRSGSDLGQIAKEINPVVRGWYAYYGRFRPSALQCISRHIDEALVRWVKRKFRRYRTRVAAAWQWLATVRRQMPQLFLHWSSANGNRRLMGAV